MTWSIGETVFEPIVGAVSGETFARASEPASFVGGVATTWNPTFVENPAGSGAFYYSYVPVAIGTHLWRGSGSLSGEVTIEFDAGEAAASTPVTPGGTVGITRKDLRRMVMGDRLHDLLVLTATANGTVNTFTDTVELTDAQNAFLASQALATGGTAPNLGRVVRVIGSDAGTHTLTVTPDLPTATQVGDEWELVDLNGRGWRFAEFHRAANAVLRTAFSEFTIDRADTIATAFSAASPYVAFPDGLTHVSAVMVQDQNGDWTRVRRARGPGLWGQGYWADRAAGTISIEGTYRDFADGLVVKLIGKGRHPDLVDDTSLVYVDSDWLADEIGAQMASDPTRQCPQVAQLLRAGAEARRANAKTPRTPNLQRVR